VTLVNRIARSVAFSEIPQERQVWLWENRVPISTLSALAGKGGAGKTTYALHLIAQLSNGTLPGEYFDQPQTVLIWSGEDNASTQLGPRLSAAGADLSRVRNLVIDAEMDGETGEVAPRLPLDVGAIRREIEATEARLVLLDPIASTMNGDLHREADVRGTLDSLARMADETGIVVMYIRHFGKGGGNASDKMSGNHAFRDAARSVFLFAADDDQVIVTQDKGNYAPKGEESFAFRLESVEVPAINGTNHMARVIDLGASDTSVEDIINRTSQPGDDTTIDHDEIDDWLTKLLANGSVKATEVYSSADAVGFSKDQAKRSKKRLGVVAARPVNPGPWFWSLSKQETGQPKPEREPEPEPEPGEQEAEAPRTQEARSLLPVRSEETRDTEDSRREQGAGVSALLFPEAPCQVPPGGITEVTPGQTDRVAMALASARAKVNSGPPRCYGVDCGKHLTAAESIARGRCAECHQFGGAA
jgi:hypothetical protein